MIELDFSQAVQRATSTLVDRGYRALDTAPSDIIEFGRNPLPGVFCRVRFELLSDPEVGMFKVTLTRRRVDGYSGGEELCKPLHLDLRNLMLGLYNKDIFPPKTFAWEFTDETSLSRQLTDAVEYISEYGIGWLEDPSSNIEWVGKRTP